MQSYIKGLGKSIFDIKKSINIIEAKQNADSYTFTKSCAKTSYYFKHYFLKEHILTICSFNKSYFNLKELKQAEILDFFRSVE